MSGKDPRREDLIAPYVRAHPDREVAEPYGGSAAQAMSMGVMVLRSKYIAWLSLLISLSAFFRDRPSVSSKSGKGPWLSMMVSLSSLVVAYMSVLLPAKHVLPTKPASLTEAASPAPEATP